ncbi:hypothetical protein [Shimia thalassica]|uniref:hypothetical protein n=1 Tax=Shimia thalassica TaxID=1715693 RepID=UPI0026E470CB|nr:hypothetical protein [Shimia thalassica]MDO6485525.1 hypothetical protein [Shimia thalassica]
MHSKTNSLAVDVVYKGDEGFLFLAGGAHGVFDLVDGKRAPTSTSLNSFWSNYKARSAFTNSKGYRFRTVIFPEKSVALKHLIPTGENFESIYQRFYKRDLKPRGRREIIYPLSAVQREEAFSKTDSHNSAKGYTSIFKEITSGLFPKKTAKAVELIEATYEVCNVSGDLGGKFSPAISESLPIFIRPPLPIELASNGIVHGNSGVLVLVNSKNSLSNKTLLIFGDSFFRAMLPLLATCYRKIVFCRTPFFHYELVNAVAPDDIFCGIAERYLSRCQLDSSRPHFLSFPYLSGRATKPDPKFGELWSKTIDMEKLLE